MRKGQKTSEETKNKIRISNKLTWAKPEILNKILGENNPEARLTNDEVIFIYKEAKKYEDHIKKYGRYSKYNGLRYAHIAKKFNVSRTSIAHILTKKHWKHITNNINL